MKRIASNRSPQLRINSQAMKHQKGVSLVELMVSMTIGLFLLGAVGVVYVSTSTATTTGTIEAEMNEDASLALEILQQQIRLAGFSTVATSSTNSSIDGKRNFSGVAVRGCAANFSSNTAAFDSLACGSSGQNSLAIRYEATLLNSQPVTSGGATLPDNCSHVGISPWVARDSGDTATGLMALADNRYYIANDGAVPSLYCRGRTGAGFGTATALIPNIEQMKIEYGVTAAPVAGSAMPNQITAYVDANNAALGNTAANWNRVVAIRICLLARSGSPVPKGNNAAADLSAYTDCSGVQQATIGDGYLRRAYVTTIQLRNMRPGLPAAFNPNTAVAIDPYSYLTSQ